MRSLKRKLLMFLLPVVLFFSLILMVIVIVTSTFAVSNNVSTVNACGNKPSESNSSQPGNGLFIPSDKVDIVKTAFQTLNNWDGSTRSNPVKNGSVSADFNKLDSVHMEAHNGVDLASTGGAFSIVDGVVVANTFNASRGNLIAIAFKSKDGKAMTYQYQHLASVSKNVGDVVKMGEQVGIIGNTGVGTGVHLHIEVEFASMVNDVPTWVGTYPTNPQVMFDALSYFQLPREFSGGPSSAFGSIDNNANQTGERCSSSGIITSLEGNSNAEKIYKYLVNQGFTQEASAGIIGNLMQESQCDPKAKQNPGPGRGIMQWTENDRWASMITWANGKDPWALETQIEWMMKEMSDYGVIEKMKVHTDVKEAVMYFEKNMERAGIPVYEKRLSYALDALAKFGN